MNKIPTSKKGLKIAGIFGVITGISIVIAMRINDNFMNFVLDHMIVIIVIIGVIGGLIGSIYTVLEYKKSLK
jgi:hypothetical protein